MVPTLMVASQEAYKKKKPPTTQKPRCFCRCVFLSAVSAAIPGLCVHTSLLHEGKILCIFFPPLLPVSEEGEPYTSLCAPALCGLFICQWAPSTHKWNSRRFVTLSHSCFRTCATAAGRSSQQTLIQFVTSPWSKFTQNGEFYQKDGLLFFKGSPWR